ncbi:HepT-like ribonuclease domain-containing protein [Desulfobacca acetoxidans]|uniref:DUF86 domain-containing protein n=1 Tax=Desulfobacca acetoxidans (strain ATCC 700848 / DSM 11109 / ASRB2) TaxID=880072 RepID=F2NDQ0_DESAR|nr:HepT-like ribonuclease domain-containing protein [Desulfobacca acetoxidans]AEB10397.1 protein of unknown function DUF86 [Desulfobacca acetoxidans DSM 11109]
MPLEARDPAFLFDMVQVGEKIIGYIKDENFASFIDNDLLKDAVERNLAILGETARKLSKAFKQEHPEIPWRQIIALRNVLIHEYEIINEEEICEIITRQLPELLPLLEQFMPPIPSDIDV